MSAAITKQDLNNLREAAKQDLQQGLHTLREGLEATSTANTKEIIGHFNKSQGFQNERMDQMDSKLDAIIEMLTMKREMRNLVRELAKQGITLDESPRNHARIARRCGASKIFVS